MLKQLEKRLAYFIVFTLIYLLYSSYVSAEEYALKEIIRMSELNAKVLEENPDKIALSPDGNNIYTTGGNFSFHVSGTSYPASGAIGVFSRNPLNGSLTFIQEIIHGQNDVVDLVAPGAITTSPDGRYVYVAAGKDNYGRRAINLYERDLTSGILSFVKSQPFNAAHWLTISQDGRYLYAVETFPAIINVYSRDINSGELTHLQTLNGEARAESLGGAMLSDDGRNLYVAVYEILFTNYESAILVYSVDSATGLLTSEQVISNGQDGVSGLTRLESVNVSSDGKHVYFGAYCSPCYISVFNRNQLNGSLSFKNKFLIDSSGDSKLSSDGNYFYTLGGGIDIFNRNQTTGVLDFLESYNSTDVDFSSLKDFTVSDDAKHIYILGYDPTPSDDTVSIGILEKLNDNNTSNSEPESLSLSINVNQLNFSSGDTLDLDIGASNLGLASVADVYFVILIPNGDSLINFTSLDANLIFDSKVELSSQVPLVAKLNLAKPFSVNIPSFFRYNWKGNEPVGKYSAYFLMTHAGSLRDGSIDTNDILVLRNFDFFFNP